jgi:TPR repeat protein
MDEIENKYCFDFKNDIDEKKIISLFKHDIIEEYNDGKYWYYVGLYYERKIENYDLMKKYYFMAIDKGNTEAMVGLGEYYYLIENNCDLMKKYYFMAIDKGNDNAMYRLGSHYDMCENRKDLMEEYYLMAINKNNDDAMYGLGVYYYSEENYELMKKYYLMAIEKGNCYAMYDLGYYYEKIEENYELMKKYYLMAIDKNNDEAMNKLGYYYERVEKNYDLMKKYYLMAINKGNNEQYCKLNGKEFRKNYEMYGFGRTYINTIMNLGDYYYVIEKNYNLMKKYYLMKLEKGLTIDTHQHHRLVTYYNEIKLTENDIIEVIKYKIENINLNMKIIFECNFINKHYKYLHKYNNTRKYIDMINLIYCN